MHTIKNLWNRTGPILAARVIQLVFGFLVTFIVAGWLPADELGKYYMLTAVSIGCHFVLLNSLHFPIQRLMPSEESERRKYISTIFFFSYSFIFISIITFVLLQGFAEGQGSLLVICFCFAFSETLFSQVTNVTSAMRQSKLYFGLVLIRSALIFFLFIFIKPIIPSADTAILFFVLGNVISSFALVVVNRNDFSIRYISFLVIKMNFVFSWAYSISNIFVQVVSRGDRLLVGIALGSAASGIYSVASDLSRRTLQGICVNSRLAFVRDAVDAYVEGDKKAVETHVYKIVSSVLILGIPTACVLSVFSTSIFEHVLPREIIVGSGRIWTLAPFVFLCEALRSYGYSLPFELSKKTALDTIVAATGCAVFIILFLPFVYLYGVDGGVVALAIAFNIMIVQSIILARSKVGIRAPVFVTYLSLALAYISTILVGEVSWWWNGMSVVKLISVASLYGFSIIVCQAAICYLLRPRVRN